MVHMDGGLYLISNNTECYFNQGILEHLFNLSPQNYVNMLIYSTSNSITIGRNMYYQKVPKVLACRKLLGGGLSLSNKAFLNIEFICKKEYSSIRTQSAVISLAFKILGLPVIRDSENRILYPDGKEACINNFDKSGDIVRQSVQINLNYFGDKAYKFPKALINYNISRNQVVDAVVASFTALNKNAKKVELDSLNNSKIDELANFFSSEEWLYSNKPIKPLQEKFAWGNVMLDIYVKDAIINNINLYTDAPQAEFFSNITHALIGCPYLTSSIQKRILEIPYANKYMHIVRDLFTLFDRYLGADGKYGNPIVKI